MATILGSTELIHFIAIAAVLALTLMLDRLATRLAPAHRRRQSD